MAWPMLNDFGGCLKWAAHSGGVPVVWKAGDCAAPVARAAAPAAAWPEGASAAAAMGTEAGVSPAAAAMARAGKRDESLMGSPSVLRRGPGSFWPIEGEMVRKTAAALANVQTAQVARTPELRQKLPGDDAAVRMLQQMAPLEQPRRERLVGGRPCQEL